MASLEHSYSPGLNCNRSKVIDSLQGLRRSSEGLAYFYCNRFEEDRRKPDIILKTLVKQLSHLADGSPLFEPVVSCYNARMENGRLTEPLQLKEGRDLILQLTNICPQTTIVIDALDECEPKMRKELIKSIKQIVEESKNLVKVFISSRDEYDIVTKFSAFVRIEAKDNSGDIRQYVNEKVAELIEDEDLLMGSVSSELMDLICSTLGDRADGMYVQPHFLSKIKFFPGDCNQIVQRFDQASDLLKGMYIASSRRLISCVYIPLRGEGLLNEKEINQISRLISCDRYLLHQ